MSSLYQNAPSTRNDIDEFINDIDFTSIVRLISYENNNEVHLENPEKLPRLAYLFESRGLGAYKRSQKEKIERRENVLTEMRLHFKRALSCWRALLYQSSVTQSSARTVFTKPLQDLIPEIANEGLSPTIFLAFRIGFNGLLSTRTAEVRLILKDLSLESSNEQINWHSLVLERIFGSFVRLVRKANGWEDIVIALQSINELRQFQREYEKSYLDEHRGTEEQNIDATVELLGLYHLAQIITIVADYLKTGKDPLARVLLKISHHRDQALMAFEDQQRASLTHIAELLWLGCQELARNSIWGQSIDLGPETQRFINILTNRERSHPVIELWPSQQEALQQNFLNIYPKAISVQMPTSGGKTLLAKFAIMQAHALRPDGLIAYIVPTRALVNQLTIELREDFRGIFRTEQAIPAFEIDPMEDRLLETAPHILVTTPEKLDFLIRREHPVAKNISMVIVDEAHNIGDDTRGARLELLLGTIKRDRLGVRFLLLSPFLPNGDELLAWLGEDRVLPPITIDWKPNRKIIGTVSSVRRGKSLLLEFETQNSAHAMDIKAGMHIIVGQGTKENTIKGLTRATVQSQIGITRGTVLVLCYGRKDAVKRAEEIAQYLDVLPPKPDVEATCHYIEAESGFSLSLTNCLRKGVTYHHSGLSPEARWLIEGLIRRGHIKVICGTTTLAQGVNFPVTTVILERLTKGKVDLTPQDFWNIAGRAGRTLVDPLGIVAFPVPTSDKRADFTKFLQKDANAIVSQLTKLVQNIDLIGTRFNIDMLQKVPELSPLLQFLAHALRVAGYENVVDEVEELLRSSLIYRQIQNNDELKARRLLALCRTYLEKIQKKKGLVEIADQTGFATPSVSSLMNKRKNNKELTQPENWGPERLFNEDLLLLKKCLDILSTVPELELNDIKQVGRSKQKKYTNEAIAGILRDWVKGDTIAALAQRYANVVHADKDKESDDPFIDFSSFLFSTLLGNASWGMGALETVYLAGYKEELREDVHYIPSMIYFGVQQKEAIWLRMAGVPRIVADNLAHIWQSTHMREPNAYDDIRSWVAQLNDRYWKQAIPENSKLTPDDMRLICREFAGQ